MIKHRSDLNFYIFTKRIDRFTVSLPEDWNQGYANVIIGCTVENQEMADYRLPIFKSLPIVGKSIVCAPLLGNIYISPYLDNTIKEVLLSGESGTQARICDYQWVLDIRQQCITADIPFAFHHTGAKFLKDGKLYRIRREHQISQAYKAGIDYKMK